MQALATLIGSIVSGEASEALGRARRAVIAYAFAGLLALCGAGFLVAAAYMVVAREIGGLPAALWFGGGFIVLALLLLVVNRLASRVRAAREAQRRREETRAVVSAAAIALLPALLTSSRARGLALVLPAAAALAYGVWRENKPRRHDDD